MLRFLVLLLCILTNSWWPAASVAAETKAKSAAEARDGKAEARDRQRALSGVKSWAIQLRYLDRAALAAAPVDMAVIDHAPHPKKDIELPFSRKDIEPLKVKPDGTRRIVLAYLSVGEAERYRYYWKPEWDTAETRPQWLGAENPKWPGDYAVDFSSPEWQAIIFGTPGSFLDRIIAAGFDGIFLDRVDAFQDVEDTKPGAEDAMMGFVTRLADHARRANPKFIVLMQNAEELAKSKPLLARLDAIAKEDLLFGHDNSDAENSEQMVQDSIGYLRRAKRAGLKVFVLEYAGKPEKVAAARGVAEREGFVIHFTERLLGTLSLDGAARADGANPRKTAE